MDHRDGNPFRSTGSHFEIKFKRISAPVAGGPIKEYVCLNLHLSADSHWGEEAVKTRLQAAARLFSAELGVRKPDGYHPETRLRDSFGVTLENYEENGFSCRHEESGAALERYLIAKESAPPRAEMAMPAAAVAMPAPAPKPAGIHRSAPPRFTVAAPPAGSIVFGRGAPLSDSDFPSLSRK